MAQLTVHNAQIKTAAVEIRTLTISGKQVTLAVFRQLRESVLVTPEGTLQGLPWGTVNYHPDKCADSGGHRHVVWQLGDELRRSLVREPPPLGYDRRYWSDETDAFVLASWCANGHRRPDWLSRGLYGYSGGAYFTVDGVACEADGDHLPDEWTVKHECGPPPDLAALRADVAAEQERRERYRARWAEIIDLPQLFIAI